MSEQYVVVAGPKRPEVKQRGFLEKGSGQSVISGDLIEVMNSRQDIGLPNFTEAWARRVIDSKKPSEEGQLIDVKDTRYKGQIELLPWGDKDGTLIPCRYLKGYNTIDMQYQDLVLNAEKYVRDDQEGVADLNWIRLQSGDNFFNPEQDKYLILMLRAHYMNKDSKCANPNDMAERFHESNPNDMTKEDLKPVHEKFQALTIVNEAAATGDLTQLKNLYIILKDVMSSNIQDSDIYLHADAFATEHPDIFLGHFTHYMKGVQDDFSKAQSYNILDLTKDGVVAAQLVDQKKEILIDGVPGKKEAMLEWIIEHLLEEKPFKAIFRLKQILETLK